MTDPASKLAKTGRHAFGTRWEPEMLASAPGRLELLGNHVDYNGGLVLAGAIDRSVTALAGSSGASSDTVRLCAPDVSNDVTTVSVGAPERAGHEVGASPGRYLAGIIQALQEANVVVRGGFDIIITGNVPIGFGMSSSAALCVSLAMLLSGEELEPGRIVAIARRAEHITGAPVGAMDQSASVAGGVILFDGTSASVDQLDPDLGDHVFAVANSGVHHALGQSAYPTRVEESRQALELLRRHADLDIEHLGELSTDVWSDISSRHPAWLPERLHQRVQHVVSEVERVREGVRAIEAKSWERFGELMTASGRSSAVDYDISDPTVEELVAELSTLPGVLGARMMGGGEGGPALALVHREAVPEVRQALASSFFARHNLGAENAFEVCTFGPGASMSDLTSSRLDRESNQ